MEVLQTLKEKWRSENFKQPLLAKDEELVVFESRNDVILPIDLKEYFKQVNGTNGQYDEHFFQFYSLSEFGKIIDLYSDWQGIPDFKKIANTLDDLEQYYVIANYCCHSFCYAIRLGSKDMQNEILVVCGGEYKKIANSFTEFVELYFVQSIELLLPQHE